MSFSHFRDFRFVSANKVVRVLAEATGAERYVLPALEGIHASRDDSAATQIVESDILKPRSAIDKDPDFRCDPGEHLLKGFVSPAPAAGAATGDSLPADNQPRITSLRGVTDQISIDISVVSAVTIVKLRSGCLVRFLSMILQLWDRQIHPVAVSDAEISVAIERPVRRSAGNLGSAGNVPISISELILSVRAHGTVHHDNFSAFID